MRKIGVGPKRGEVGGWASAKAGLPGKDRHGATIPSRMCAKARLADALAVMQDDLLPRSPWEVQMSGAVPPNGFMILPPTSIAVGGATVDFDQRFGTGAMCGPFN